MTFFLYSFLKLCDSYVEFGSRNEIDNIDDPMRLNSLSKAMQDSLERNIKLKQDLTQHIE